MKKWRFLTYNALHLVANRTHLQNDTAIYIASKLGLGKDADIKVAKADSSKSSQRGKSGRRSNDDKEEGTQLAGSAKTGTKARD